METSPAAKSAPVTFEQGGVFIVPHLLWHVTSVYTISNEGSLDFTNILPLASGPGGLFLPE